MDKSPDDRRTSGEVALADLAPPGVREWLHVIPDEADIGAHVVRDADRRFEVNIELRPGAPLGVDGIAFEACSMGDTALVCSAGRLEVQAEDLRTHRTLSVELLRNPSGRLGRVHASVTCDHWGDAHTVVSDLILPLLSKWSFDLDVPLAVGRASILDPETGAQSHLYEAPCGLVSIAGDESRPVDHHYQAVFSLYREALCSPSPFYRFLCLFKVIDLVLNVIRSRNNSECSERPEPQTHRPSRRRLCLPNRKEFGPHKGSKVGDFYKNVLIDARNEVAHSLLDGQQVPVILDRTDVVQKFEDLFHPTRWVARNVTLVEMEFENAIRCAPTNG